MAADTQITEQPERRSAVDHYYFNVRGATLAHFFLEFTIVSFLILIR